MTRDYSRDFTAISLEGYVSQGAADWCKAHGHATYKVDGKDIGYCPRCLEVTKPADLSTANTDAFAPAPIDSESVEEDTQPMAPETLYVKSSGIRHTYTNLSWIAEAWNAYGARVSVLTDPAEIAAVIGDSNNMRA